MCNRGYSHQRVVFFPTTCQCTTIHNKGLRMGALYFHGRHHQAFKGISYVVAVDEHLHWVEIRVRLCFDQLVEDEKQPVWVNAAGIEIVVPLFAVVEMEPAKFAVLGQARNDHCDVHVWRMVAKIVKTFGLFAHLHDVGLEGRLIHFVFDQKRPIVW